MGDNNKTTVVVVEQATLVSFIVPIRKATMPSPAVTRAAVIEDHPDIGQFSVIDQHGHTRSVSPTRNRAIISATKLGLRLVPDNSPYVREFGQKWMSLNPSLVKI